MSSLSETPFAIVPETNSAWWIRIQRDQQAPRYSGSLLMYDLLHPNWLWWMSSRLSSSSKDSLGPQE
jgi:hypothetical protein